MPYPQLPEASTETRLDAFLGVEAPPILPLSMAPIYPNMYPILGASRPPLVGMYGAGGVPCLPNHQCPNPVYPPVNLIPVMLPINGGYVPQTFYPFPTMLLGNPTTAFLSSVDTGYHEELAPPSVQWPLPMQPISQQQAQDQVPQDIFATMQPPQELGSTHWEDHKTKVESDTPPPAPKLGPEPGQWDNQSGSHLPEGTTMSEESPQERRRTDEIGNEQYHCGPCRKWVLVRRRKYHDKKHSPEEGEFVCDICKVLGKPCKPLSRKDALKRHVEMKHPKYARLLRKYKLKLLTPRRKDERSDLVALRRAMFCHRSREDTPE